MQRLTAGLVQYGCDCCTRLKGKGSCTRGQSLQFTSHLCSSTHLCSWGLGTDWKGEIVSTMKWAFLPRLGIPQEKLENVFFLFCSFFGKGRLECLVCLYCCLTSDKLQKMVVWLTGTFTQRVAAIVASAKCPGILLAAFYFISKRGQTLKMHSKAGPKNFLLCSQPWSNLAMSLTWDMTPDSTHLGKSQQHNQWKMLSSSLRVSLFFPIWK